MRDPNRIDEFCAELARVWHQVPDWRFGQLLSNTLPHVCEHTGINDIFFIEDGDMIDGFTDFFGGEQA